AGFADTSIRSVLRHPAVEAVTWWCSHDVSRELADFPEVEYTLGLFDEHGAVKPIGEAISQIAREPWDGKGPAPAPQPCAAVELVQIDGLDPNGSNRSVLAPRGEIFTRWIDDAPAGAVRPLAAGTGDPSELHAVDHSVSPVIGR